MIAEDKVREAIDLFVNDKASVRRVAKTVKISKASAAAILLGIGKSKISHKLPSRSLALRAREMAVEVRMSGINMPNTGKTFTDFVKARFEKPATQPMDPIFRLTAKLAQLQKDCETAARAEISAREILKKSVARTKDLEVEINKIESTLEAVNELLGE